MNNSSVKRGIYVQGKRVVMSLTKSKDKEQVVVDEQNKQHEHEQEQTRRSTGGAAVQGAAGAAANANERNAEVEATMGFEFTPATRKRNIATGSVYEKEETWFLRMNTQRYGDHAWTGGSREKQKEKF